MAEKVNAQVIKEKIRDAKSVEDIFNKVGDDIVGLTKSSEDFLTVVDEIADKISDIHGLNLDGQDLLEEYLKNLDDLNENWQEIQEYVEEIGKSYKIGLADIRSSRNIVADILNDIQNVNTQTNQNIRLFRNLGNVAGEINQTLVIRGGLEEKSLNSLERRTQKAVEELQFRARMQAGILESDSSAVVKEKLEKEHAVLQAKKSQAEWLLRNVDLEAKQRRELVEQVKLLGTKLEIVDPENYKQFQKIVDNAKELKKVTREQRKQTGFADGLASLVGKYVPEVRDKYEENLQTRVDRQMNLRSSAQKMQDTFGTLDDKDKVNQVIQQSIMKQTVTVDGDSLNIQDMEELVGNQTDMVRSLEDEVTQMSAESEEALRTALDLEDKINKGLVANTAVNQQYINDLIDEAILKDQSAKQAQVDLDIQKGILEEYQKSKEILEGKVDTEVTRLKTVEETYNLYKNLTATQGGSWQILKGIGSELISNLFNSIKSISVWSAASYIFDKVWNAFKAVNDQAVELKRRVGSWEMGTAAVNDNLATSVDWLKTATDLADFTGLNSVTLFSKEQIADAAEFKNLTGTSAELTNNLVVRSKLVGQNLKRYREGIAAGANEGNRLNRSVVQLGEVQASVLKASDATALSYGNNAESLGRAVVAAKNLGMELEDVEKTSDKLLNFSSSIKSEMEAQLLTGMQLNLSRAREYALMNDLEGVATEIQRQGVTAEKFTGLNRIQQEKLAEALGMSRNELAKSLILRELNNGASAEALAAATNMTAEEVYAISLTDRWEKATQKLVQAFTPLLEVLLPIAEIISNILTSIAKVVGYITGPIGKFIASWSKDKFDQGMSTEDSSKGSVKEAAKKTTSTGSKDKEAADARKNVAEKVSVKEAVVGVTGLGIILGLLMKKISGFIGNTKDIGGGGFFKGLARRLNPFSGIKGSVGRVGNATSGVEAAEKASKITVTGSTSGLDKIGTDIVRFLNKFRNVGSAKKVKTAVQAVNLVGGMRGVAGVNLEKLPVIGSQIQSFMNRVNSIKNPLKAFGIIAGLVVASVALVPAMLALSTAGVLSYFLPMLGKNLGIFFSAINKIPGAAILKLLAISGAVALAGLGIRLAGEGLKAAAPVFESAAKVLITAITSVADIITTQIEKVAETIQTVVGGIVDIVKTIITGIVDTIQTFLTSVGSVITSIGTTFASLADTAKNISLEDATKLMEFGGAILGASVTLGLSVGGLGTFALVGLPVLNKIAKVMSELEITGKVVDNLERLSNLDIDVTGLKLLSTELRNLAESLEGINLDALDKISGVSGLEIKQVEPIEARNIETIQVNEAKQTAKLAATVIKAETVKATSSDNNIKQVQNESTGKVLPSLSEINEKLNTMIGLLREGQTINFDGQGYWKKVNLSYIHG